MKVKLFVGRGIETEIPNYLVEEMEKHFEAPLTEKEWEKSTGKFLSYIKEHNILRDDEELYGAEDEKGKTFYEA